MAPLEAGTAGPRTDARWLALQNCGEGSDCTDGAPWSVFGRLLGSKISITCQLWLIDSILSYPSPAPFSPQNFHSKLLGTPVAPLSDFPACLCLLQTLWCFKWTVCLLFRVDHSPTASYDISPALCKHTRNFILWGSCNTSFHAP